MRKRATVGRIGFFSPSLLTLLFHCVFSLQWHLFKSAGSSLFQYWVHLNDDGCARYSTQWTIYHISILPMQWGKKIKCFFMESTQCFYECDKIFGISLICLFIYSFFPHTHCMSTTHTLFSNWWECETLSWEAFVPFTKSKAIYEFKLINRWTICCAILAMMYITRIYLYTMCKKKRTILFKN